MSKELTVKKDYDLANYEGGDGFEDVDSSDLILPFLKVAQALTPEVVEGDAKAGQFVNTVTGEALDSFVFHPVVWQKLYVEWEPGVKGKMLARHTPDSDVVAQAIADNGGVDFDLMVGENPLNKTIYVYGQILDDETGTEPVGFAVISFSKTKLKVANRWITSMKSLRGQPPLYMHRGLISTQSEQNDYGTFFNYKIAPFGKNFFESLLSTEENADTIVSGLQLRDMVLAGQARAQEQEASTDEADDEIPF